MQNCASQLFMCDLLNRLSWRDFLEQMLGKNDQVLNIDDAIAPGHGAYVTQGVIRAPVIDHDDHIGSIDNAVGVKVNDGDY